MGIVASFSGYYLYRLFVSILGESRRSQLISAFVGAWSSVFLASIVCAIELAVSGTSPIQVALPAMAGVYAVIGIGEGLITGVVLSLVLATRADLLQLQKV
jgi:cobalt/nickel transport system permease protein